MAACGWPTPAVAGSPCCPRSLSCQQRRDQARSSSATVGVVRVRRGAGDDEPASAACCCLHRTTWSPKGVGRWRLPRARAPRACVSAGAGDVVRQRRRRLARHAGDCVVQRAPRVEGAAVHDPALPPARHNDHAVAVKTAFARGDPATPAATRLRGDLLRSCSPTRAPWCGRDRRTRGPTRAATSANVAARGTSRCGARA